MLLKYLNTTSGAWWAAIYGVTQSRTQLKRLSSSSISKRVSPRTCVCIVNTKTSISVNDDSLLFILWWVTANPSRFCVEWDTGTETRGGPTVSKTTQMVFSALQATELYTSHSTLPLFAKADTQSKWMKDDWIVIKPYFLKNRNQAGVDVQSADCSSRWVWSRKRALGNCDCFSLHTKFLFI